MYYEKNMDILKFKYPEIYHYFKTFNEIKINSFELEKTKNNLITAKYFNENKNIFIHSKYNPLKEAETFSKKIFDIKINNYVIYGLGFGYHIHELLKAIGKSKIFIIECNEELLFLSLKYIDLQSILLDNRVKLIFKNDIKKMATQITSILKLRNLKIEYYESLLKTIPVEFEKIKYLLSDYKTNINSMVDNEKILIENFENNILKFNKNIDSLFGKYFEKPIFIISAGPSLNKNVSELKNINNKGIILSVGKALKTLEKHNITPNFFIITDAKNSIYSKQIKKTSFENIPSIGLSTCDKNYFNFYQGEKFIALQKGFELAEDYAIKNNHILIETGGSVATAALDIAIKLGGNPIIFVGQDLAFTEGISHSKETYSRKIINLENYRKIKDIHGEESYTSNLMYIYLKWIENRIKNENKNIDFIDATEGGAKIEGTKIMTLKEVIKKYII